MKKSVEKAVESRASVLKENVVSSFNKEQPIKQGWIVVMVAIMVLASVFAYNANHEASRAKMMSSYYQNQYYQGLKEAEIQQMTAWESHDYAVKMFNIDVGRYLYQDLRVIGFVLAVGLMLGLTFHGFKIVYVKRNG